MRAKYFKFPFFRVLSISLFILGSSPSIHSSQVESFTDDENEETKRKPSGITKFLW